MNAPIGAAPPGRRWLLAIAGGLLLAAATPPAWFPGAEWLVLGGLMAWFAVATNAARPALASYLFGCLHMACFSWSLRHILLPAYFAVVLLGGLYFVLGTVMLRRVPAAWRVPGFAVAVGATFWLRAYMPEIYYPHGQPVHCLWEWPRLLGALWIGGEPLGNALLASLAAAAVEGWRSWRLGVPHRRRAQWQLGLVGGIVMLATSAGADRTSSGVATSDGAATVSIAAIESGVHPIHSFEDLKADETWQSRFDSLFATRLVKPTSDLLSGPLPPELILWPESSVPARVPVAEIGGTGARLRVAKFPARPATRLVVGVNLERDGRETPGAVLLGTDGRILGHQEKRRVVPGGEFLPFVDWLPAGIATAIHDLFQQALGSDLNCTPGQVRPPLQTAGGVPFGVLMCYDNAYPGPAAEQVAQGARFLCVLSNEAWYRHGAELTQLVAMTVCRAIELRTPIVRCTTDGWSAVVTADGRLGENLAIAAGQAAAARILRTNLSPGSGHLPPLAWLQASAGPVLAGLFGLVLLHAAWVWARLRVARTAPTVPEERGAPRSSGRTGS